MYLFPEYVHKYIGMWKYSWIIDCSSFMDCRIILRYDYPSLYQCSNPNFMFRCLFIKKVVKSSTQNFFLVINRKWNKYHFFEYYGPYRPPSFASYSWFQEIVHFNQLKALLNGCHEKSLFCCKQRMVLLWTIYTNDW